MTKDEQAQLNTPKSAKLKHKRNRLAEMSAIERLVSGCQNPYPVAKPCVRYAAMFVLSRRV